MHYVKIVVLLSLLYYAGANINMEGPTTHTPMLGSDSQVPCKFTSSEDITDSKLFSVTWYIGNEAILSSDSSVTPNPKYYVNLEQALRGTADLTIYNISIADTGVYKCYVTNKAAKGVKEITINVQAPPQITVINNAVKMHQVSFLCCEISRFYPKDINITWFRDGESQTSVLEGKARKNSDRTYSANSSLLLTPTEEDRERNFSCRVEHVSLPHPLKEDLQLVYGDKEEPKCEKTAHNIVIGIFVPLCVCLFGVLSWHCCKNRKQKGQPHEQTLMNQLERPAEEEETDTLPAMDRPSSEMEPSDEEEFSNLNDTEAEDPKKP